MYTWRDQWVPSGTASAGNAGYAKDMLRDAAVHERAALHLAPYEPEWPVNADKHGPVANDHVEGSRLAGNAYGSDCGIAGDRHLQLSEILSMMRYQRL